MAKYVLVPDTTLSRHYRNYPLLDFLPCAPSGAVPPFIYEYLKGEPLPAVNGRAPAAPYALRKLEAALLREHRQDDVVIPHESYIEEFIGEDTEVIGVYTMDPLGIAPLTLSYAVLFNSPGKPYVRLEFERLIQRLNRARRGLKAKLVVGGPGVWEFTVLPEELARLGIDYAFQGEAEDVINDLFRDIAEDRVYTRGFFRGFQSFDERFNKVWIGYDRFISRARYSKQFPTLEEIPPIRAPSIKGLVEVMRGCGIGCDFCEVTLRALRYYPPEYVRAEVSVNVAGGYSNAWVQSDEIFAYMHGRNFEPNQEAILELFSTIMATRGVTHSNPTHGRISIPAGYPELIQRLSRVLRASRDNWIGIQVGIETGSERLAKIHMPNKTLPLRIGADGSWQEIVIEGTKNLNRYYWKPAFTVQVGQPDETPEDNWDTVELINKLSTATVNGRELEFTVTPMQNVSLGLLKSRGLTSSMLDKSQLAVYYACYRHLAKMVMRIGFHSSSGDPFTRAVTTTILLAGGLTLLKYIEQLCKKRGLDPEKVKRYGLA
jgi:radical SAM superfamily enzyme YgiQ (UPF0313 family)